MHNRQTADYTYIPAAWLVDTDVHFSCSVHLEGQRLDLGGSKWQEHPLGTKGVPVGPILADVHLTEIPATQDMRKARPIKKGKLLNENTQEKLTHTVICRPY